MTRTERWDLAGHAKARGAVRYIQARAANKENQNSEADPMNSVMHGLHLLLALVKHHMLSVHAKQETACVSINANTVFHPSVTTSVYQMNKMFCLLHLEVISSTVTARSNRLKVLPHVSYRDSSDWEEYILKQKFYSAHHIAEGVINGLQ